MVFVIDILENVVKVIKYNINTLRARQARYVFAAAFKHLPVDQHFADFATFNGARGTVVAVPVTGPARPGQEFLRQRFATTVRRPLQVQTIVERRIRRAVRLVDRHVGQHGTGFAIGRLVRETGGGRRTESAQREHGPPERGGRGVRVGRPPARPPGRIVTAVWRTALVDGLGRGGRAVVARRPAERDDRVEGPVTGFRADDAGTGTTYRRGGGPIG